jgi:hypothetical protein
MPKGLPFFKANEDVNTKFKTGSSYQKNQVFKKQFVIIFLVASTQNWQIEVL